MSRLSVALLLILCACADGGTAPDTGPTAAGPALAARPNPSQQPFQFTVTSCIEPVLVTGTFHEVDRVAGDGAHIRFHINAKGVGVGLETGARYQWNDRLFDNSNLVRGETRVLNDFTRSVESVNTVDFWPPTNSRSPLPSRVTAVQPWWSMESGGNVLTIPGTV